MWLLKLLIKYMVLELFVIDYGFMLMIIIYLICFGLLLSGSGMRFGIFYSVFVCGMFGSVKLFRND